MTFSDYQTWFSYVGGNAVMIQYQTEKGELHYLAKSVGEFVDKETTLYYSRDKEKLEALLGLLGNKKIICFRSFGVEDQKIQEIKKYPHLSPLFP